MAGDVNTSGSAISARGIPCDVARFGIGARSGRLGQALPDIGFAFVGAYRSRDALSVAQLRSFGLTARVDGPRATSPAKTKNDARPITHSNDVSPGERPRPTGMRISVPVACQTSARRERTSAFRFGACATGPKSSDPRSAGGRVRTTSACASTGSRAPYADLRVATPDATLRMVIARGRTFVAIVPCR
jgi:hypothetical protein